MRIVKVKLKEAVRIQWAHKTFQVDAMCGKHLLFKVYHFKNNINRCALH